jgi:hypothetical protein
MSRSREDVVDNVMSMFTYHPPSGNQATRYNTLREEFRRLALKIIDLTPICADQTVAIRKLWETSMAVNATIACNEETDEDSEKGGSDASTV